ncbi:hypothetical protein MYU51_011191 [Penicillium brevicompactum]
MEKLDNTPEAKEGDEVTRTAALSISAQIPKHAQGMKDTDEVTRMAALSISTQNPSKVLMSSLDVMLPKDLSLGFPKLSLENPTVYPNQPEICLHKGRKRRADSQSLADSESTKIPKAQLRRFVGFVNHKVEKKAALYFASKIYELPVPESVTHRMVVWTSGILHEGSGAVGVVWMKAPHGTEAPIPWTTNPTTSTVSPATWEVKGREYPGKRITDNTVGHFAIATAALEELIDPSPMQCTIANQITRCISI